MAHQKWIHLRLLSHRVENVWEPQWEHMWTDNQIDWDDTSPSFNSNSIYDWEPKSIELTRVVKDYPNGKRLRKGERRPDPFYLQGRAMVAHRSHKPEVMGSNPIPAPFLRCYRVRNLPRKTYYRKFCGAYSRKYDKVRKFRRRRLFWKTERVGNGKKLRY